MWQRKKNIFHHSCTITRKKIPHIKRQTDVISRLDEYLHTNTIFTAQLWPREDSSRTLVCLAGLPGRLYLAGKKAAGLRTEVLLYGLVLLCSFFLLFQQHQNGINREKANKQNDFLTNWSCDRCHYCCYFHLSNIEIVNVYYRPIHHI